MKKSCSSLKNSEGAEGTHDFTKKCSNVETEGQSSVSRRKKQVKPLFVTDSKWTVGATECYSWGEIDSWF